MWENEEAFYHGLILGMLRTKKGWEIKSEREAGGGAHREAIFNGTAELARTTEGVHADTRNGRADIIALDLRNKDAYIIEVKYSKKDKDLNADAQEAINLINKKRYDQYFSGRSPQEYQAFRNRVLLKAVQGFDGGSRWGYRTVFYIST